ncbi:MAG: hypothetical protein Q6370_025915, partial [Candidatus Sigynarchaeota archaeon]
MKTSPHYLDLDDQLPSLPAPGAATRDEKVYFSPGAFSPSSPVRVRACAVAAAWITCGILVPVLFSMARMTHDIAASVAAWALFAANAGMALAVLLSWLATRTARKAGHARVEPPARALETGWSWKDIPLTPYLGTRHLVRAMKQHPLVRYRYVLAFKECSLATFLARSGMREANRLAVAARMNPQERARWYDACEGGWRVSFRVAVAAADEAALASSTAAMDAAIEGTFHGFAFEKPRRHRDGHRRDHRHHRRCREAY